MDLLIQDIIVQEQDGQNNNIHLLVLVISLLESYDTENRTCIIHIHIYDVSFMTPVFDMRGRTPSVTKVYMHSSRYSTFLI